MGEQNKFTETEKHFLYQQILYYQDKIGLSQLDDDKSMMTILNLTKQSLNNNEIFTENNMMVLLKMLEFYVKKPNFKEVTVDTLNMLNSIKSKLSNQLEYEIIMPIKNPINNENQMSR